MYVLTCPYLCPCLPCSPWASRDLYHAPAASQRCGLCAVPRPCDSLAACNPQGRPVRIDSSGLQDGSPGHEGRNDAFTLGFAVLSVSHGTEVVLRAVTPGQVIHDRLHL